MNDEEFLLSRFAAEMAALGLNYAFMEWKDAPQYPYFVGEYSETDHSAEDGSTRGEILLTGWTRGAYLELSEATGRIKAHFAHHVHCDREQRMSLSVDYTTKINVPTDDAELKSVAIRLGTSTWEGGA